MKRKRGEKKERKTARAMAENMKERVQKKNKAIARKARVYLVLLLLLLERRAREISKKSRKKAYTRALCEMKVKRRSAAFSLARSLFFFPPAAPESGRGEQSDDGEQ